MNSNTQVHHMHDLAQLTLTTSQNMATADVKLRDVVYIIRFVGSFWYALLKIKVTRSFVLVL